MRRGLRYPLAALLAVSLSAVAFVGSSSAAVSKQQAAAQKAIARYLLGPSGIDVTAPLKKLPPKGKRIALMSCGIPACETWAASATQAVKAFGWTTTKLEPGEDPATITSAFNQVLNGHYSAVFTYGIPETEFAAQGAALKARGIPIIDGNTALSGPDPALGITEVFDGKNYSTNVGEGMAEGTVALLGTKSHVLFVGTNAFASVGLIQNAFASQLKNSCSTCSFSSIQVAPTDVATGKTVADAVAYVQGHPSINVVEGVDAILPGLYNALQTAGLTHVRVAGAGGTEQTLAEINAGTDAFTFTAPDYESGYTSVDELARYYTHQAIPTDGGVTFLMMDHANINKWPWKDQSNDGVWPFVKNYKKDFTTLWGVK